MTGPTPSSDRLRSIEQLLYQEASCLDQPDLDRWISLYTQDGTYWMPAQESQTDPELYPSHIYDDRVMMEIRRRNFTHPRAASKEYRVRCSHIISNIQVIAQDHDRDGFTVTSNFHALVYYLEEQRFYGGTYTHHLENHNGELKIRHKRVDLINCEAPQGSLTIYL